MGDFNDDPFDASLTIHAGATREQGDVARAQSARFYNLSWRYLTQAAVDHRGKARDLDGTLYFSGDGNVFDQILVARGLLAGSGSCARGWKARASKPIRRWWTIESAKGRSASASPKGDAARNVNVDGYSDHFPVSVRIDEAD